MPDERDIGEERQWLYQERATLAVASLQKRNTNARYVTNRQEALSVVMAMIPEGVTVVCGDSVTLEQVGIVAELRKRNKNIVLDPMERAADGSLVVAGAERLRMQRAAFSSEVFLAGANAVTLDGKLVNTDALGNRVAPMIFGPDKVIVVAGANKIVKDVSEAIERIHRIAAPMNARRHGIKHHMEAFGNLPCARTGICVDCNNDSRICRYTVIIDGSLGRRKDRINVVLVGEELGI
ncbi:MAG: lactate utilization protein [Chloroflexi bacterium]|nr:lactate utilization protein [Chloroflexota bacterium]